jgi:hypothetical protein
MIDRIQSEPTRYYSLAEVIAWSVGTIVTIAGILFLARF